MKTLMKPLMTARNSRNLCRRPKHQVRALVNLRMDKTAAQGVHESGHEGFMMSEQVCGVGPCGCTDRTIRTDKTPAHGVHDCNHEPLMTAPRLAVIGVGATARFVTRSSRRSVSRHRQPSKVTAEYGSSPEITGTPAPGPAFMSSFGLRPSLDRRLRCGRSAPSV